MRNTKKVISILLTLLMVVGMMSTFAFAAGSANGSIEIKNASIGETYEAYKIFNAKVAANGGITYQEISENQIESSEDLKSVFEVETDSKDIKIKTGATDETVIAAVKAYTNNAGLVAAKSEEATSNTVTMTGLEYGYYYVKSSLGAVISITSTNPKGIVKDKNAAGSSNLEKKVNGKTEDYVKIGDTVTYTVTFKASNYVNVAESKEGKQVSKYIITDTLPTFLTDVEITSLKINGTDVQNAPTTFTNKKIEIPWVDTNNTSLYKNKVDVELTYTAKVVKDTIVYAGAGNTNTVTLTWDYVSGTPTANDKLEASAKIYTYAIALKKINKEGEELSGAEFKIPYKATRESEGVYVIDASEDGETTVKCDAHGIVVIKGVDLESFDITETKAPDGYNLLTTPTSVAAVKNSATSTNWSKFIDPKTGEYQTEKSDVYTNEMKYTNDNTALTVCPIVNFTGTELPTTGGIGTTIFYLIGAILVIGAGVVFVTRRRMHSDK